MYQHVFQSNCIIQNIVHIEIYSIVSFGRVGPRHVFCPLCSPTSLDLRRHLAPKQIRTDWRPTERALLLAHARGRPSSSTAQQSRFFLRSSLRPLDSRLILRQQELFSATSVSSCASACGDPPCAALKTPVRNGRSVFKPDIILCAFLTWPCDIWGISSTQQPTNRVAGTLPSPLFGPGCGTSSIPPQLPWQLPWRCCSSLSTILYKYPRAHAAGVDGATTFLSGAAHLV